MAVCLGAIVEKGEGKGKGVVVGVGGRQREEQLEDKEGKRDEN